MGIYKDAFPPIDKYDSPINIISDTVSKMNNAINTFTDSAIYSEVLRIGINIDKDKLIQALHQDKERYVEAFNRGYSTAKANLYNVHEVAKIIEELFGDTCACNFNGIDEWLPYVCKYRESSCPYPNGSCWEQYLIHKYEMQEQNHEDNTD